MPWPSSRSGGERARRGRRGCEWNKVVVGGERLFFLSCFFYLLLACSLCSPPSSSSSRTPPQQKRPRCLELGVGSGYVIASAARLIANRHRFHPSGGLRPEFADDDDDPASSPPSASSSASSRIKKQAALFAVDVSPSAARDASATLRAHSQRKGEGEGKEESTTPIAAVDVALADNDVPDLLRLASTHGLSGEVVAERSADEERLFVLRLVLKS